MVIAGGGAAGTPVGSCLTLDCPGDTGADSAKDTTGKGARAENSRVGSPGAALPVARSLGSYGDGIGFRVVSGQSF